MASEMITFRANDDDIQRLRDLEKQTGLSRSEILRSLIRSAELSGKSAKIGPDGIIELKFTENLSAEYQQVRIVNYVEDYTRKLQELLSSLKNAPDSGSE